jgi:hypothetical protein
MNFKSQICTDRLQSEKLLALGLKKETADMVLIKELAWDEVAHCTYDAETYMLRPIDYLEGESHRGHIPAWSLGRLWELYWSNKVVSDCLFGCGKYMNPYAKMIAMIEYDIEDGTFNKDYLEDEK